MSLAAWSGQTLGPDPKVPEMERTGFAAQAPHVTELPPVVPQQAWRQLLNIHLFFKSTGRPPNPRLFFLITKTQLPKHLFPYNHFPHSRCKRTLFLATPHQSTALPPNPRRLHSSRSGPARWRPSPLPTIPSTRRRSIWRTWNIWRCIQA